VSATKPTRSWTREDRWTVGASIVMFAVTAAVLPFAVDRQSWVLPDLHVPWWWLLVPLAIGTGIELRFRIGSSVWFATVVELPLVLGLYLVSGRGLVAALSLGGAAALTALRYRPALVVYNAAGFAMECSTAVIVFHAVVTPGNALQLGGWLACVLAIMTCAVAGSLRNAVMERIRRRSLDRQWFVATGIGITVAVVNATFAFIGLRLVAGDVRLLWLVGALLVVLVVAYRNYISLLNHHEGLDRLYESTQTFELITANEGSIRTMLEQALELLGGEEAELVSVDALAPRRFLATRVTAAAVAPIGEVSSVVATQLASLRDSDGTRSSVLDGDDERTLLALLYGSSGPLAVLRVSTDRGLRFSEGDRRLFEMFVNHASVALQNSQLVDQLRDEVAQRKHEALHDALTALPNRVMFDLHTRRALSERSDGELVGVALLDIDHFKEVNDTLGHDHGDELLAELAHRLEVLGAERDLVVSRLGGDEFAVLVTSARTLDEVAAVADDVKAAVEATVEIAEVRIDVTASVGISVYDDQGGAIDGSTLLRQADVAMYIAKGQHLGVVFYDRADDPYSPKRLSLAADLRHAVDRGEIEAYFQPEIDLHTGDVISVEALARWTHPVHGTIVPDQFIPIAEQSGLIRDLTYLMLEQSLERIRQWGRHGYHLHVAVNLSVRCLGDEHLVERVMRMLDRSGLGPEHLTLEVTEGTIMADPEHALAVLGRLHEQGIRLSIDDFGMGYSSLAQLKRMPVGQLKVDRSFVTYVSDDCDDAAIVKSVTDLGHNLGLEVIAEGVEDRRTLDKLIELGCDSVQGFYLARPMSADQTLRWLRDRERQRNEPGFDPKFAIALAVS